MPSDSFDNLPRAMQPLTTVEGYRAMLRLLEYYFHVDGEYPVGGILGDLSAGVWADGSPGDPAAWTLWLNSIDGKPHGNAPKA
jgi:hypothetical protein